MNFWYRNNLTVIIRHPIWFIKVVIIACKIVYKLEATKENKKGSE